MLVEPEHSGLLKHINQSGLKWFLSTIVHSPCYEFPVGFTERIKRILLRCFILRVCHMKAALMHRNRRLPWKDPACREWKAEQKGEGKNCLLPTATASPLLTLSGRKAAQLSPRPSLLRNSPALIATKPWASSVLSIGSRTVPSWLVSRAAPTPR